jgi:putative protease
MQTPPTQPASSPLELVCPAGSLPALKAAVDHGADCVYLGFKDATNARNFNGLNFEMTTLREGIRYAREHRVKVLLAINTYPQPASWKLWAGAVDRAADLGVDAVILADAGLMQYASRIHPGLRLHLSVQGSATNYEAINFYHEHFGIARAILPRVLTLPQVEQVLRHSAVEIEVFGFGNLGMMLEGRCALSSYITGESPTTHGVCCPASVVRWRETTAGLELRLNGIMIDRYAQGENTAYPTPCKGRFEVAGERYYAIEEPTSLNTLELLPQLFELGVRAVKIEGRQRSPAYVAQVTRIWRAAIDTCRDQRGHFSPKPEWMEELDGLAEGQRHTLGAFYRPWK